MKDNKTIIGICGSATRNSANLSILKALAEFGRDYFEMEIVDDLAGLPHFDTNLTDQNTPKEILDFRSKIEDADGVIICTPEYIFSIPSRLKNAIEWCVSTTIFSDKPTGLITASASGMKGHEELRMIMRTVQAKFTEDSTLLVQGVKGKVNKEGMLVDKKTEDELNRFIQSSRNLLK